MIVKTENRAAYIVPFGQEGGTNNAYVMGLETDNSRLLGGVMRDQRTYLYVITCAREEGKNYWATRPLINHIKTNSMQLFGRKWNFTAST